MSNEAIVLGDDFNTLDLVLIDHNVANGGDRAEFDKTFTPDNMVAVMVRLFNLEHAYQELETEKWELEDTLAHKRSTLKIMAGFVAGMEGTFVTPEGQEAMHTLIRACTED